MQFNAQRDIAVCGLACVLCSEADCPGCRARERAKAHSECELYRCAAERGVEGCYRCDAFPCDAKMLQSPRVRAFNRYAQRFGRQALIERLRINDGAGIVYHRADGLQGDYDKLSSEEEMLRLIQFGTPDPYRNCPTLQTPRYTLRLVRMEDAEALLACYSDPKSQPIFNADNCTSDFRYQTLDQMKECIRFFLDCYAQGAFIRFAIVDKVQGRPVGTVEMFGDKVEFAGRKGWGMLRIDLASPYETQADIGELLALSNDTYDTLMGVPCVITKAIPTATERIAALQAHGFRPFDWPDGQRADYWVRDSA